MEKQKRGPKGPRLKKADKRVGMSLTCKARHRKELERMLKKQIAEYERKQDTSVDSTQHGA
jgi:hypothetical protein